MAPGALVPISRLSATASIADHSPAWYVNSMHTTLQPEKPKHFSEKITLVCERDVAYESPDHLVPKGTRTNNTRNKRFNRKLYWLFFDRYVHSQLKILDIGCSGGGFVRDCIDSGCLAIGLEGSDYSKKRKRAEWATIPDFLFTCDVTKTFELKLDTASQDRERIQFDAVTSWEVLEHIHDRDLDQLAANVKKHLAPHGLWIMSVSSEDDIVDGVNLHQTVKPREWWIARFKTLGLHNIDGYIDYFNTQFVRGPKTGNPGFHLVLSMSPTDAPKIPRVSWGQYFYDRWLGSDVQKILRRLVVGDELE